MTLIDDLKNSEEKTLIKLDSPMTLNDKTSDVTSLSTVGLWEILKFLQDKNVLPSFIYVEDLMREVGIERVRKEPNFSTKHQIVGRFTTRLSKYLYEERRVKLTPELRAQVGNFYAAYQTDLTGAYLEVDKTFDWDAGEFGDSSSCFWGGRKVVLDMFKEHPMFYALKFYGIPTGRAKKAIERDGGNDDDLGGIGRCWAANNFPYGDMITLFNAYGLSMTEIITLLTTLYPELSSRKIILNNNDESCGTLYINSAAGYVLGTDECLDKKEIRHNHYFDFTIPMVDYDEDLTICEDCGSETHIDEGYYVESMGGYVCESCYDNHYSTCDRCGYIMYYEETSEVRIDKYSEYWCDSCIEKYAIQCADCDRYIIDGSSIIEYYLANDEGYKFLCNDCVEDYTPCAECVKLIANNTSCETDADTGEIFCTTCFDEKYARCDVCNRVGLQMEMIGNVCEECIETVYDEDEIINKEE